MDNFFRNMFRKRDAAPPMVQQREATAGVPATTDPKAASNQPKVAGGSYQSRIIYANRPETALTVSPVFRAVELRMKTMGVMPVQYRKKDYDKGNFYVDMRGLGKRMNYLLQEEPNPLMTAAAMWELVTYNQLMFGNGFVYIERDEFGFPKYLWLVRNGGYNTETGKYTFIQYLSDEGYREKVNVPREDVMHFANTFRYSNGFWGKSTLDFAAETLSLNKTLRNQSLETAAKGGRVKLLLGEDGGTQQGLLSGGLLNKDQMNNYAKELQDKMYAGQDILSIRGLDKVTNISMTSAEMQAAETMNLTYDDCARLFGVPRPLLMLDTNSHYNDYQNATMEFHTRTILPEKADREHEIFRKLIGFKDYGVRDIHICEKPLLAMDPERQAKVDQLNLQTGAKTVNEIRAEHDMPSVEKGDIVYISTNVAELGSTKLSGESPTELKPGTYTVGEPPKEGDESSS